MDTAAIVSPQAEQFTLVAAKALGIASGGALAFGSLLIVLLLLNSARGPGPAYMYGLAYGGTYTAIAGLAYGLGRSAGPPAPGAFPWGGVAYLVLGLLLAFVALRRWRKRHEAEAGPPRLLRRVDNMTAVRALVMGTVVAVINFKNLAIYISAISVVIAAGLPVDQSMTLLGLVIVTFCGSVIAPLVIYLVMPRRSARFLAKLRQGVERHSARIIAIVLPFFAAAFFARGLWGLLPYFLG